jgi:hypothetical protein
MQSVSFYHEIKNKELIKNDLLKPIHEYARRMSPKPIEVSPGVFRQECYSEYLIRFEDNDKNQINMMSRPAIQQFMIVKEHNFIAPEDCFPNLFAFRCTWWVDKDVEVEIINPDIKGYAFYIPEKVIINFKKLYPEPWIDLQPAWIPFFVKKNNQYMKPLYGKIEKHAIAYDMVVK